MKSSRSHDDAMVRYYLGEDSGLNEFERLDLDCPRDPVAAKRLWEQYLPKVLPLWIARYPGTRPLAWWKYTAPERCRRQVGGSGVSSDAPHVVETPEYTRTGIPTRIENVNPADPPRYESQASYLQHHGLLTPDEVRQLDATAYEPVVLPASWWDPEDPDYGWILDAYALL